MSELWDNSGETSDMDAENLEKMKEYRRTHKLEIPCEYFRKKTRRLMRHKKEGR